MRVRRATIAAIGLSVIAPFSCAVRATEAEEMSVERIHSSLPLYTFDWEQTWPRSFASGDDFGCTSRVAFGDWRFTPDPKNDFEDAHWQRFTNYGVFHCAAIFRSADQQPELDEAQGEHGFFVQLGKTRKGLAPLELWAIQKGTVPGSEYVLLAREPGEAMIEKFIVLQQRCPAGKELQAEGFDIWITRYCAINSRADLLSMARKMATLQPQGTIERMAVGE